MKKRILIVDDDPLITKVISQILGCLGGYETRAVNKPDIALVTAQEFRPDAVVLDYQMPGMTGEEVLAALRHADGFTNVPAILLSGDSSWTSVAQDEVTKLLPKPLTADSLIQAARTLISNGPVAVPLAA